jgi:trigger factor
MTDELLNIKINKLSESSISVEFEVSADCCQACYVAALSRLVRNISLPGFRTGKIPKQVIVQQIGVARIKAAALQTLIDNTWQ